MQNMIVDLNEIEKVTLFLLSKLRESKGNEIEIKNDFYWDISTDELYNPYENPKNLTLGQLSDDMEELRRLNESDHAVPYDIKRLAVILMALSAENPIAF